MNTFMNIKANDRVYYRNRYGKVCYGRAQKLLLFPGHVVLDIGRGRPQIVDGNNYVANPTTEEKEECN